MNTKQRKTNNGIVKTNNILIIRYDLIVNLKAKGKFVIIWTYGYQFWNYYVKNQFKQRVILIQTTN